MTETKSSKKSIKNHSQNHPENSLFLDTLFEEVLSKIKNDNPEKSYSAFLASLGIEKITKKITEEAFEVAIASISGSEHKNGRQQIINESADLIYHLLVLLAYKNINLQDVIAELKNRNENKDLSQLAIAKNKIKI